MKKKILISISALVLAAGTLAHTVDDRLFEIVKNLDVFGTMFRELNGFYVDEINPTHSIRIGIEAMLKDLDPYTVFYSEDLIEDYLSQQAGNYNGIGANIQHFNKQHVITMLFEDAPALKAGLNIGDEIIAVNGVDLTQKDETEFGRLLKGQIGIPVKLTIKRYGERKTMDFTINRESVKVKDVPHYGMIDEQVGYIQLRDFNQTAAAEVKEAFLSLKSKGMTKLVLDLRNNPGGLLHMAVEICNFFIPKGSLVVETKGKVKDWNKKYNANQDPLDLQIPIAVLVNKHSASASEIVSGTLQDYDRAVIIGQRSFGKGLVQTTRDLSYNARIKVTTAKYYIPSGRCIQAIDYSEKTKTHQKLPDSLRAIFYTKAGRKVLDGGGIDPELPTTQSNLSEFSNALASEYKIFDYATKYYYEHVDSKPKENFELGSSEMQQFYTWLSKNSLKYKTKTQASLEDLINSSDKESALSIYKNQLITIKKEIDQSIFNTIKQNETEIKEQLELEILGRYYYQKVMKFASFKNDEDIQEALKLFENPVKMKSLLQKI